MMWTRWLGMIAFCTLTPGCHLANNVVHNLTYETKLAAAEVEEHFSYAKLAKASWAKVVSTEPHRTFSKDYADGFNDGFVDLVKFGGSGQPPYVPPKRYWGAHYRTPEGYRAVEDWFAGFRHGAASAQRSEYRRWVPLPSAQTTKGPGFPEPVIHPTRGGPAPFEESEPASSRRPARPKLSLLPPEPLR